DHAVELHLDGVGIQDVAGFRLVRTNGDTTRIVGGSLLAPSTTLVVDSAVVNGVTYSYSADLFPETAGGSAGEPPHAAPDPATPGPDRPWAIDTGSPPLVALSSDVRRERARFGDGGPYADVVIDSTSGAVWTTDENDARILRFDESGALLAERDDLAPVFRL